MIATHAPVLDSRLAKAVRYAQVTSGPVATAGAHFALSLVLLHRLAPDAFGRMSFMLVASQLSGGLWSALFCAPLPVLLANPGMLAGSAPDDVRQCMLGTNLVAATVALALFLCTGLGIGLDLASAALFAAYGACFLLRWLARAHAYTLGQPLTATASDLAYSTLLMASLALIWQSGTASLAIASAALLASALLSLLPFGGAYLRAQFRPVAARDIAPYARVWRLHSRWSLVGVLTTEATTNAHAYLLALVAGPAAFAPVAASALLIRPIGVVVNAVTEFERPRLAGQIGRGDMQGALGSLCYFRAMLGLAWAGSAVGAAIVLAIAPRLVVPARYDLDFIVAGTALWMAVALVRQWRTADSVLLQAGGEFRALAQVSMASSVVSVVAVSAFLWRAGALWSIAGILCGEIVCAGWTWRQARRYRRQVLAAAPRQAAAGRAAGTQAPG